MPLHTIYVSREAHLHIHHRQLCIERAGVRVGQVPVEEVAVLLLEHPHISITHTVLASLMAAGAVVIACNDKHMPTGLMMPIEGNGLQHARYQTQLAASKPLQKKLWQQTVQAKIRNQAHLLTQRGFDAAPLYAWAEDVKSGDTTNREARAAATYWKHLFDPWFDPHDIPFTRDPSGAPPNNLLNYGYAILRAHAARAIVAAGLLTTLGIHHANQYNAYCLADDLMEPYRPYVDQAVIAILEDPHLGMTHDLTPAHKAALLRIATHDARMDGKDYPLEHAIQRTANSLVQCFGGEARKLQFPELPWFTSTDAGAPTDTCG